MIKKLFLVFVLILSLSFVYSAEPEYVSIELYNLSKLSTAVVELKFGNGTDIRPCGFYINNVSYVANYSSGYCSHNITDFPTVETLYVFKGYYNTNTNMTEYRFTYFPTADVVAEVPAMGFFSVLISIMIVILGVIFS